MPYTETTMKTGFALGNAKRKFCADRPAVPGRTVVISAMAAFLSAACVMGPDYKRPDVNVPQAWRLDDAGSSVVANTAWWEGFQDSQLNALIREALSNNYDVRAAAARVQQFKSALKVDQSAEYPQASYDLNVGRDRLTENNQVPLPAYVAPMYYQHIVAADASYELDLWGRVRRSTEAGLAELLYSEEGQRTVVLTLVSDVASAYLQLLSLDKQLQISRETLKNREDALKLSEDRFTGGVSSALELAQVKALYEEAAAAVPDYEKRVELQENALSVLVGRNPGPITRGSTFDALTLPGVPGGLPSDILKRRPDVRAAEQLIVASNARIGEAKTEYFPTLSLTSQVGFESSELYNWLHGSSMFGELFGGSITGTIFNGGKIGADVDKAKAITDENTAKYQKTVQTAFSDVDNALISHKKTGEQAAAIDLEVNALKDYAHLAEQRYEGGYSSYIEVLVAERSLYTAEIADVQAKSDNYTALVGIYKAMGGGWPIDKDPIDKTAPVAGSDTKREAKS